MAVHIPIYGHIWIWICMVIFFCICICIWKVFYFPPYMVRIWHIRGFPKPHPQFIFSPVLYYKIYFFIIIIPLKYTNILFSILNLLTFVNFFWSALKNKWEYKQDKQKFNCEYICKHINCLFLGIFRPCCLLSCKTSSLWLAKS